MFFIGVTRARVSEEAARTRKAKTIFPPQPSQATVHASGPRIQPGHWAEGWGRGRGRGEGGGGEGLETGHIFLFVGRWGEGGTSGGGGGGGLLLSGGSYNR